MKILIITRSMPVLRFWPEKLHRFFVTEEEEEDRGGIGDSSSWMLFCARFNSLLGYNLISGSWDHQKWVFADVDNHHIWQNSFCDNHDVWQKSSQLCRVMVLAQEGSEPNQEEPLLRQLTNQFLMRPGRTVQAREGLCKFITYLRAAAVKFEKILQ